MYFESRTNQIKNITELSIDEQVDQIKTLGIGSGLIIKDTIWVNDANQSGCGINEVAVLLKKDEEYFQMESLTIPWIENDELAHYVKTFLDTNERTEYMSFDKSFLKHPIKFNNQEALVWFTCGCCGESFKSTIKKQNVYDQDAGFGICPDKCARHYD